MDDYQKYEKACNTIRKANQDILDGFVKWMNL